MNIAESVHKLFNTNADNYIFVYTPPKVGSTTLVTSLRVSLGKRYTTVHIHDEVMLSVLTGITGVKINDIIRYLSDQGKNVFVIDVYRTPVERKMSEFFEKISPYHFNNTADNLIHYSLQRIIDRFNKVFPHIENNDHYLDRYDIADPVAFDFEKKYSMQTVNRIQYIKLRLCDSTSWDAILSEIFQTDIVIIHDYKTEDKPIGALYNQFKAAYKLPSNYIDLVKHDKYLNVYYNELERREYVAKWGSCATNEAVPYTTQEYHFYLNICLENQYINDIEIHHYIDNGCVCAHCSQKRKNIFIKAKSGQNTFDKIIHPIARKSIPIRKASMPQKFKPNQFAIHISNNVM